MRSDLTARRQRIDEIDLRLVQLLHERAEVVLEIADCKRRGRMDIVDKAREEVVLRRASARSKGPFPPEAIGRVFRSILRESRLLQKRVMER